MILGGAVVRNPGRQAVHLVVETAVPVLRQADILPEQRANTTCDHLYLAVQMLYLEPAKQDSLQQLYLELAQDVVKAAPSLIPILQEVSIHVACGDYYRALQVAKRLRRQEQKLLEQAAPRV